MEIQNLWLLRMRNPCWLPLGIENPWQLAGIIKNFDSFCGDVRILHDFPGDIGILQVCLRNLFGESRDFWRLWLGITPWESLLGWGIGKTLAISTGDQTKENLDLLENKEGSDGFYRELRMRIFILLRSGEWESSICRGLKILTNSCWGVMKALATSPGNKKKLHSVGE